MFCNRVVANLSPNVIKCTKVRVIKLKTMCFIVRNKLNCVYSTLIIERLLQNKDLIILTNFYSCRSPTGRVNGFGFNNPY